MDPSEAPRRPLGVTVVGLFYIVLGSHALMFGAYLASLAPEAAPSAALAGILADDPGLVRAYGLGLVGIAAVFFAIGIGLLRRWWWARWAALAAVALHIVGPPFQLGGVLFAAVACAYLFGSEGAGAWLGRKAAPAVPPA